MNDAKKPTPRALTEIMGDFAPNSNVFPDKHQGNLCDALWSLCRQHGEHRMAEQLTEVSNRMRAAQWEVLGEKQAEHNTTLFELEAVKAWVAKNRKDISPDMLEDLLQNPAISLIAGIAYAAGYEKSRERDGYAPTFAELDAGRAKKR